MIQSLLQSAPWWAWLGFHLLVFLMLALDLGVFNRKAHAPSVKEAAGWSVVWVTLALLFNVGVWKLEGGIRAGEWFTGYLLEKSLSVDNLFVIVLIFTAFKVEGKHQHRILYWGVLGALVMRAAFILAGTALIARFHWLLYAFGAFLVWTGAKMLLHDEEENGDPSQSWLTRTFRRVVPFDPEGGHARFTVVNAGRRLATPGLLVLLVVEVTDLVFAVDSIPAVLGVTRDPFVVYTSNIFAILGLRSLYFLLAGVVEKFHLLKIGLSLVLVFVGVKMLIIDFMKIPVVLSLGVIALLVGASVVASLLWPKTAKGH